MATASDAPEDELDMTRGRGPVRILLTLVVATMVAMWIWIYLFAPRGNADRLESRAFAEAAEAICAPLQEAVDGLPSARQAATPQERADQVADGTRLTEAAIVALRDAATEHLTLDDDIRIVEAWLADWDFYVEDRWIHVDRLDAADENTPDRELRFTLRERAEGGIYTRRIEALANVNDMESCRVPGDV